MAALFHSETHAKPPRRKAREGEAIVTSLRIDKSLWKNAKIYAIHNGMTMRELIESLLIKEIGNKEIE